MALSLDGTTGISASGNISGNNIIVTGSLTAGSFSPTSFSASGNVTGGNILTSGLISATGNITGAYILGNGSQLTGVDATQIINGTSNARVVSSGGNIAVGIGGTANVAVFASTGQFVTGDNSVSGNVTGGNILTAGVISATGNITGSFILGNGSQLTGIDATSIQSGTSNVRVVSSGGNVTTGVGGTSNVVVVATTGQFITGVNSVTANVTGGNILTAGLVSATGAITGAALTGTSLTVSTGNVSCGNIVNTNANGVGNIGSSATRFNQVFALASSAQYADLAEKYTADADYVPGTVLEFGGDQEVTATTTSHSTRVAGIVSTQPSYIMNDGLVSDHTAMVSLTGRVPCLVQGPIAKGDRLVASAVVGHAQRLDPAQYEPGCIIGKALEDYPSPNTGTIEVAVGRF